MSEINFQTQSVIIHIFFHCCKLHAVEADIRMYLAYSTIRPLTVAEPLKPHNTDRLVFTGLICR